MMPSPMKSQRMDRAPMTGVMMNGSREMKMIGPRIVRTALLTATAMPSPSSRMSGNVISVNVSVNRRAAQKSMLRMSSQRSFAIAFHSRSGSRTLR